MREGQRQVRERETEKGPVRVRITRDEPSNRKNWRLEKIGDSGTKPVILKYWRCTTYCKHLATTGEITQQESYLYDELALLPFYRLTYSTKLPRALLLMFLHGAVE